MTTDPDPYFPPGTDGTDGPPTAQLAPAQGGGASVPGRPRRKSRLRWALAALAALAASGGGYAWATSGAKRPNYVLGTARLGSVSQTIGASGTLQPAASWTLSFPSQSLVTSVNVAVGDRVSPGQVLASIDPTPLQAQLAQAQAQLAQAQAKAAADASGPSAAQTQSARSQLSSAQVALANANTNLAVDQQTLSTAQARLASAQTSLSAGPGAGIVVPAYAPGYSLSATQAVLATDQRIASYDAGSGGSGNPQASAAQAAVGAANKVVGDFEQQAAASNSVAEASAGLAAQSAPAPSATVAADQAAVSAAQYGVTVANDNLAKATLVAPASGIVAAVNVAVGQSTGGGSAASSAISPSGGAGSIVIEGRGAFQAVVDVSDAQISQVHPGQNALITPAGQTSPIQGSVASIAPTATTTSGVATYPVTVSLDTTPQGLLAGMSAQASIVVSKASGVVVPSSAVHTSGAHSFVFVLANNVRRRQPVTLGASGSGDTLVTSGLSTGDAVILANSARPLPTGQVGGLGGRRLGGGGGRLGVARVGG